jgi:hypothetical protein
MGEDNSVAKSDRWELVNLKDDEPKPIPVNFTCFVHYKDKVFKAGGIHLDVLGIRNIPYVAMMVERAEHPPDRFIEVEAFAHPFFISHGLPTVVAKALVNLAVAIRDERG